MRNKISVVMGDITTLPVDAIVNAAKPSLLGGGGVDGAIHEAAGKELFEECLTLGGCMTGFARITKGYNLPAKFIIHTVGPIWAGGNEMEADNLASCYRSSLELANSYNLRTVAFPCISTGIYGYPKEEAARIAILEVKRALSRLPNFDQVIFCCFSKTDFDIYQNEMRG